MQRRFLKRVLFLGRKRGNGMEEVTAVVTSPTMPTRYLSLPSYGSVFKASTSLRQAALLLSQTQFHTEDIYPSSKGHLDWFLDFAACCLLCAKCLFLFLTERCCCIHSPHWKRILSVQDLLGISSARGILVSPGSCKGSWVQAGISDLGYQSQSSPTFSACPLCWVKGCREPMETHVQMKARKTQSKTEW